MIALTNVSKTYGKTEAVVPTSLYVESEQCVALVGPSGSGKSTILRLVLGLITPDTGTVEVAGQAVNARSGQVMRLRMGYVIQDGGLFPHLTAAQNVTLVARQVGWKADRIAPRFDTLTRLTGLSPETLRRYPVELSGGERQRVGVMRALMLDPPVLLLDEPLGALDPLIRARLQEDLKRIFRQLKKTVLLITHDMSEAAFLGDEIAIMHHGQLLQKGPIAELVRRPAAPFVAEFLRVQRPRWSEEHEAS